MFLSWIETELSFSSNLQMMTAYHHKLFLLTLIYSAYFFVEDATMTHPYKWVITEFRVKEDLH